MFQHCLSDLEEEAGAVHARASVFVLAAVRGAVQELRDEVKIIGLDLDAIESSFQCILCGGSKIRHRLTNFSFAHGAGGCRRFPSRWGDTFLLRIHIGSGHGWRAIEEVRMRHRARMPEL